MAKIIKNILLSLLFSLIALAAADILLLLAGIRIPIVAALLGFAALTAFLIFFWEP